MRGRSRDTERLHCVCSWPSRAAERGATNLRGLVGYPPDCVPECCPLHSLLSLVVVIEKNAVPPGAFSAPKHGTEWNPAPYGPSAAARMTGEPASGGHRLHHRGRFVLMMRVASIGAWPRTRLAPITRPVRRVRHDPTRTRRPRPPAPARALELRPHRPGMGYRALHHPTISRRQAGGASPAGLGGSGRGSLPAGCSMPGAALRSQLHGQRLSLRVCQQRRTPEMASLQRADRRVGVRVGSGHRWTNNARRMTTRRRAARVSRKGRRRPWGGPSGTPLSVPADQKLNGDPTTKSSPLKNSTYMMPDPRPAVRQIGALVRRPDPALPGPQRP